MKSEHSQVQESDLLADKIEQKVAQLKPYLPALLGLIGLSVVAMLGYGVYASQQETRAARAWTDFYFSDTQPQNLEAISKDFADTSASSWARLTAGDANMSKAMEKWNIDRNLSDQFFQQALDDYRVVAGTTAEPFAKSRALQGMAQALEGLGDRDEAIAEYKKITAVSGLPADLLAEINSRIQWLESRGGEAFFGWYSQRSVTPAVPAGDRPFPNLPNLPDIQFPPTGGLPGSVPAAFPGATPETTSGGEPVVPPGSADPNPVTPLPASDLPATDATAAPGDAAPASDGVPGADKP